MNKIPYLKGTTVVSTPFVHNWAERVASKVELLVNKLINAWNIPVKISRNQKMHNWSLYCKDMPTYAFKSWKSHSILQTHLSFQASGLHLIRSIHGYRHILSPWSRVPSQIGSSQGAMTVLHHLSWSLKYLALSSLMVEDWPVSKTTPTVL